MTPDVSVIIPAYNARQYIRQAIDSVLNQTLTNIEVIVVDDASIDDTNSVIKTFTDSRIRLITHKQNRGVGAARNSALQIACGRWIAVLDADDWYAPNRLEILLALAIETDVDIIADDLYFICDRDDRPWSTMIRQSGRSIVTPILITPTDFVVTGLYGQKGLHLGVSKPLYKREFLSQWSIQYDDKLQVVEDFLFDMECLLQGAKFLFVPTPYYFYRSRQGSLVTQSQVRHIQQFYQATLLCMQHPNISSGTELYQALLYSLKVLRCNKAYYSVVEPLKQHQLPMALARAIQNPLFFIEFLKRIQGIINRRFQYYLLNNKLVYKTMYQDSKPG